MSKLSITGNLNVASKLPKSDPVVQRKVEMLEKILSPKEKTYSHPVYQASIKKLLQEYRTGGLDGTKETWVLDGEIIEKVQGGYPPLSTYVYFPETMCLYHSSG